MELFTPVAKLKADLEFWVAVSALSYHRNSRPCVRHGSSRRGSAEAGSRVRNAEHKDELMVRSKQVSDGLAAAEDAEHEAAEHRDTPQKKAARMDELEERARLFGDSVKQSYNAKCLERKWLRFLLVHGDEIGFKASIGPTVKQVERFVTYCFCTRDVVSAIGREGVGDSYELQIRYMLAKFVFVSLGYKGWTKLSPHELHGKAEPYKFATSLRCASSGSG